MLKIENVEVLGWEHAIRGMRNPKNSWAKSDSGPECPYGKEKCCGECQQNFCIGPNDKLPVAGRGDTPRHENQWPDLLQ